MVMKLKFKVDNPCWFKIVASSVSSLDPCQSPLIQVKAIYLTDNLSPGELNPSLEIEVDPKAPPRVAIKMEPMP
eukprot:jgi/Psemu1/27157/gm1.27157_g